MARKLGERWLLTLALDRALARSIVDEQLPPPGRALLSRIRGWVTKDGLLEDWLPEPSGAYRSGKAQLDLCWVLGRLWVLAKGVDEMPDRSGELEALFHEAIRARKPRLAGPDSPQLAVCEGLGVGEEEVYPSLLALMTAEQREELLLAALGR
ncbi:MAG: hypothetical protein ACE5F1_01745 [Planctomycetota bacterium]